MNDVVIPYRFSYSKELVYSLRSLKNLPHNDVFVIGDYPNLRVRHISFSQTPDIAANTLAMLNLAVENDEISENFIWMADDIFVMRKVNKLPMHHRGPYKDIIEAYRRQNKHNFYTRRMKKTYERLQQLGISNPLCYELHIPFLINKSKWRSISKHITSDLNKLSMYANLNSLGGTKAKDVKVRLKDWMPSGDFVSTYDTTFNVNSIGKLIKETFSEKSQYEK